jgi:hypothetical protein
VRPTPPRPLKQRPILGRSRALASNRHRPLLRPLLPAPLPMLLLHRLRPRRNQPPATWRNSSQALRTHLSSNINHKSADRNVLQSGY